MSDSICPLFVPVSEPGRRTELLHIIRTHLNQALKTVSKSQDNHLRALILALISAHYLHTAEDHAQTSLRTCEQLAAGLGAVPKNKPVSKPVLKEGRTNSMSSNGSGTDKPLEGQGVGNAPLRLWIGERFVELYKRRGEEEKARNRVLLNEELGKVVDRLVQTGKEMIES